MVQFNHSQLDTAFAALADGTRRGILEQLARRDASITDLAGTFRMTLTGMKKHIGVLEETGLVSTQKIGRVRTCTLGPRRLEDAAVWLEQYRRLWDARFSRLEQLVEELQQQPPTHTTRPRR
jgi:DNA-binding transcriptional ArsR family regulator